MKRLLLVAIIILYSSVAFAVWPFKKKTDVPEVKPVSISKPCYYYMEHSPNFYTVFTVFQQECSGISLSGTMNSRTIVEYDDELREDNRQTPTSDETFREKVDALWPGMQEIKFKPSK